MTQNDRAISEFLATRLADDEHWAREAQAANEDDPYPGDPDDPARVLREVAAKRDILARAQMILHSFDDRENAEFPDVNRRERSHARKAIEDLAAVYSDHPDYQEEWRP
jgi:hypothetical protein